MHRPYRRIAEAVHRHGGRVFGQLTHSGRAALGSRDGSAPVLFAPSSVPDERFHVVPRALPIALIREIVESYGTAAERMRTAGLDGVEILASHGVLPAQFLNPSVNRRSDAYGGSLPNRLRFLREVLEAVRGRVGRGVAVGVRFSGDEMQHDGLGAELVLEAIDALESDAMLDYFNVAAGSVSGLAGSVHVVPPMFFSAGYVAPLTAAIRARVGRPVFVAGRINDPRVAERILERGEADVCGMTRALICDPELPEKVSSGRLDDIRACIGCNQACIGHMQTGHPISCIQHPETGRERSHGNLSPAARPRRVLVAGAGPAGMKAAAVAAARGHLVSLYERDARPGGQARLAQLLPGRSEFGGLVTNLARELALAGVEPHLRVEVTRSLVERERPEVVVIATGATPGRWPIEADAEAHVVDAWAVLTGQANVGARVVVADWRCDWTGMGLAEHLAQTGCHVRLACNGTMAGQSLQAYVRDAWLARLDRLGVEIITYARLFGADADTVYLQHTASGEAIRCEGVDTLVTSLAPVPSTAIEAELEGVDAAVHVIGDCAAPRTAEEAVLEGSLVGASL